MQITSPFFGPEELSSLQECLNSGWVTQGPFVAAFEDAVARRHQVRHAIACTSCTSALHLAALALKLGPGDEVIVPAFTWVTSANCVEYTGAKAVFADVDPATYNIDCKALRAAITPRTRAIVAVHLFGLAAPMDEINAVAQQHGLAVIEDAACAIGTTYNGKPVGSSGNLTCFSFHPRKIVTTGEGGMVTTNDDGLARAVNSLRNHGATGLPAGDRHRPYAMGTFDMLGYNFRLSDIQAAVGVAQMKRLDGLLAHRASCAARYRSLLAGMRAFALPPESDKCGHTYQAFVIRLLEGGKQRRNAIMDHLERHAIQTRPGTHAVHRLGYYRDKYSLRPEDFPMAALCEDTTITLPIFPGMTESDQLMVVERLREALKN